MGLTLLTLGCGEQASGGGATGCAPLADPQFVCRFTGTLSTGLGSSAAVVRIETSGETAGLAITVGPPRRRPEYQLSAGPLVAGDRYSGQAYVMPYLGDLFDVTPLELAIDDAGRHLSLAVGANSFLGPATFEGLYARE